MTAFSQHCHRGVPILDVKLLQLPHTGTKLRQLILTLALRPSTSNWYNYVLCSVDIVSEWSADKWLPAIPHEGQGKRQIGVFDRHKVHDRIVFPYPA
jgi:hypothetical protein